MAISIFVYYIIFIFISYNSVKSTDNVKLLKIGNTLCRDLRDCQTYFPCSFFIYGYVYPPSIQQCPSEFIFSEEKQQCVQPITKEDFQCLLIAKVTPNKALITTKTKQQITRSTQQTQTPRPPNRFVTLKNSTSGLKSIEKSTYKTFNYVTSENSLKSNLVRESKKDSTEQVTKKSSKTKWINQNKGLKTTTTESSEIVQTKQIKTYSETNDKFKRMCIITNWSQFRPGKGQFQIEYTNLHLCNHIIFSSAAVSEDASLSEEYNLQTIQHNDVDLYIRLNALKNRKSGLKVLLRITDDNGRLYSKLARKKESRANFIRNTLNYIEKHKFDGIDIDWQYPNGASGGPYDKQNFITLLKEFKEAKEAIGSDFVLSVTISPFTDKIQNSYQLTDLNLVVDLVLVEAFDYYGPWDRKTGISSPLSKMEHQYSTEAFMNIDGTITFLKALGLAANKIVLGVAAYGRSYVLQDNTKTQLNSPSSGNGFSGSYTKINGLLSYYEICDAQKRGSWKEEWVPYANAPFMYNSDGEWVSFENEESLTKKVEFVKEQNLAGLAVNDISFDDFHGSFCNKGPYPFLRATLGALLEEIDTKNVKDVKETKTIFTTKESKKFKFETSNKQVTNYETTVKINKKLQTAPPVILITPPEPQFSKTYKPLDSESVKEKQNFDRNKNLPESKNTEEYRIEIQKKQQENEKKLKQQQAIEQQQREQKQKIDYQNQQEVWAKQLERHQQEVQKQLQLQQQQQLLNEKYNQLHHQQHQNNYQQHVNQHSQVPSSLSPLSTTQTQQQQQQNYQPAVPQESSQWQHPIINIDNNKCFSKVNGIYRDENDCSSFYICETLDSPTNIRYHKFSCPSGLTFNMAECTCDWPSDNKPCVVPLINSFCRKTGPTEIEKNYNKFPEIGFVPDSYSVSSETSSTFSCYGKEKGLHRDPVDCTKFYYCQMYNTITNVAANTAETVVIKHDFTCPAGLHFNIYKCQCDWATDNTCQTLNTNQNTYCTTNL